jgi:DNA primase
MTPRIVEQIKERLQIEDIVGEYIKLEKAGKNLKACCPFHNEKTPSFFISQERQSYYCFGCGAKGDIISFVQHMEALDFVEALKMLASRAGVSLENYHNEKNDDLGPIYKTLEDATSFFEDRLKSEKEAIEYLHNRGLLDETIKTWRVGFAPNDWTALLDSLKSHHTTKYILEAGLIKEGEKSGYYDRFRSRIIFPIFDPQGKVIAFSGRIFGNESADTAKYLNSPETPVFNKSKTLYGLNFAKQTIRKHNFAILVEGQLDLLLAHQSGYTNTIASSGTALTEMQIEALGKLSKNLVLAYDADSAGFKAAKRAWEIALSKNMDVKIAQLPQGLDPAELIQKDKEEWKKAIKDSRHIIDFILQIIISETSDKRKIGMRISEEIMPYLRSINVPIDQSHFVNLISAKTGIKEDILWQEINMKGNVNLSQDHQIENIFTLKIPNIEEKISAYYVSYKNASRQEQLDFILQNLSEILDREEVQRLLESEKEEVLFLAESLDISDARAETEVKELLRNLKIKVLVNRRENYKKELLEVEKKGDDEQVGKCLKSIQDISQSLSKIVNN